MNRDIQQANHYKTDEIYQNQVNCLLDGQWFSPPLKDNREETNKITNPFFFFLTNNENGPFFAAWSGRARGESKQVRGKTGDTRGHWFFSRSCFYVHAVLKGMTG